MMRRRATLGGRFHRGVMGVVLGLMVWLCGPVAWAHDTPGDVPLPLDQQTVTLTEHLEFLKDDQRRMSFEDAALDTGWARTPSLYFGYTKAAYFFRTRIFNPSGEAHTFMLWVPQLVTDQLTVRVINAAGEAQSWQMGDQVAHSKRPLGGRGLAFPVTLEAGEAAWVYLRVVSSAPMTIQLNAATAAAFDHSENNALFGHGAYFGAIFIMLLYNLFLLLTTGQRVYWSYLGYVASMGSFHLSYLGFLSQIFGDNLLGATEYVMVMSIGTCAVFAALFARRFLDLDTTHPRLALACRTVGWVFVLISALAFVLPFNWISRAFIGLVGLTVWLCVFSGLVALRSGYRPARFYLVAWCAVLLAVTTQSLANWGVLPQTFWTLNATQLGTIAEVTLMAFALADRLNLHQSAAEIARMHSLQHERDTRLSQQKALENERALRGTRDKMLEVEQRIGETLELSVRQQTAQLADIYQKLRTLSTLDEETGLPNRRESDSVLHAETRRCLRRGQPLAVLVAIVDRYEDMEEKATPGQRKVVLERIATRLKTIANRPGDTVARTAAAEFVITLNGTSATSAMRFAERMRSAVELERSMVADKAVTIRIGVAAHVPSGPSDGFAYRQAASLAARQTAPGTVSIGRVPIAPDASFAE